MAIALRTPLEIEGLHKAGIISARAIEHVKSLIKPGVSTLELSEAAEAFIKNSGAKASFKGLYGFPEAICISVNEVVIHGIPDSRILKEGDIVGIDVGTFVDGWYGDSAVTVGVGVVSDEDKALMECAKNCLDFAIDIIEDGMRFKELSREIESYILNLGFVPLRNYCGHGIGRKPHEEPSITNYLDGKPNQGPKIKNGMVFCIEPMICQKNGEAKLLADKWSVVSSDGLNASHFEHTVAVIDGKAKILSHS